MANSAEPLKINIILEGSDIRFLGIYKKKCPEQHFSGRILVTVLHTCVLIMLKCISMQNLIKIYLVVQELSAFSLKYYDRTK